MKNLGFLKQALEGQDCANIWFVLILKDLKVVAYKPAPDSINGAFQNTYGGATGPIHPKYLFTESQSAFDMDSISC